MAAPIAAKTKKKVEINSARYDLRAFGVTQCCKRETSDVIVIVFLDEEEEEEYAEKI